MRTLDRDYLATHPEGDEKAKAEFSAAISKNHGLPLNPDGTRQRVLLSVEADTYLDMLTVLTELHEDNWNSTIEPMMMQACSAEEIATLMAGGPEAHIVLEERFATPTSPFQTFEWEVTMTESEDDRVIRESSVKISLTAPSVAIGQEGGVFLSSPKMLQTAAIGFCPEIDDEDYDDSNEVLVIPSKARR